MTTQSHTLSVVIANGAKQSLSFLVKTTTIHKHKLFDYHAIICYCTVRFSLLWSTRTTAQRKSFFNNLSPACAGEKEEKMKISKVFEGMFSLHAISEVIKAISGIGDKKKDGGTDAAKTMESIGGFLSDEDEILIGAKTNTLENGDEAIFWNFVNWLFPKGNPANWLGRQKLFQFILKQPSAEKEEEVIITSTRNVGVTTKKDTHDSDGTVRIVERRSRKERQKVFDGAENTIKEWVETIKSCDTEVAGFEKLKQKLEQKNAPFMKFYGVGDDLDIDAIEKSVREASKNTSRISNRVFAVALATAGTFVFGWWFLIMITIFITAILIFGGEK